MNRKCAVITGASRGIGHSAALAFAGAGYDLAICCSQDSSGLASTKKAVESLSAECMTDMFDVGSFDACNNFVTNVLSRFGKIDVLINNAGISHIGLLQDMSPEEWSKIINTNLTSVFNFCRLAIPSMVHQKSGSIINVSSVWGNTGAACEAAYSASKGGVNALTKALGKELASSGITVNAIACGVIDTDMNRCFSNEEREALINEIPADRFGNPGEVAEFMLVLAEGNPYLTGQVITLDGGWT